MRNEVMRKGLKGKMDDNQKLPTSGVAVHSMYGYAYCIPFGTS